MNLKQLSTIVEKRIVSHYKNALFNSFSLEELEICNGVATAMCEGYEKKSLFFFKTPLHPHCKY